MQQLKKVATIILLLLSSVSTLWSGTTGKVAGKVEEKENGEPVIGATIIIVGTSLGAATDLDGHFTILNVPPGTFNLQVSFVGYRKVIVSNVHVFIDQTARLDISMEPEAIEMNAILVVGDRLTIKKDVATSVASVSDKDVSSLPIDNIVSAVGLQAGVRGGWSSNSATVVAPSYISGADGYVRGKVSVQGGLSIRGGEGDNILFMVDGVTMRDPRNNEPTTNLALSAVNEISVERGGFNAEYGQVRSGIINVVTKEGNKQNYSGSIQGRISPPGPKYWNGEGIPDVHDPNSYFMRPFFDPNVCWTGTAHPVDPTKWDKYTLTKYPAFSGWNAISQQLCSDNNPYNNLTPLGCQKVFEYETRKNLPNDQPDYDIDGGFGGPVPLVSEALGNLRFFTSVRTTRTMLLFPLSRPDYSDYNGTLQFITDITSTMKLKLSGMVGKEYTVRGNADGNGTYQYLQNPADVAAIALGWSGTENYIRLFSDYACCISDIGNQSVSAKLTHNFGSSSYYEVSIAQFRRDYNTRPIALRDTSQKTEILPGFYEDSNPFGYWPDQSVPQGIIVYGGQNLARPRDFTVVNSTTIKADYCSQVDFQNLVKGGIEFVYNDLNFDYGLIDQSSAGKAYSNRVQMRTFPIQGAAYLQDKLETKGFTLNLGLRLDYSNPKANWWNVDPYDVTFFAPSGTDLSKIFPTEPPKIQWQLSPRLGIAHPITENSKLFFNYGHFRELPQYESMFRVERNTVNQVTSFGNPNLITAKTISYELGIDNILFEDYLLQIAGFYNDISDQQDFTQYFSTVGGFNYYASTSNNYEDVRGFEITLRKTNGRWWSGFANYTYQVSSSGHFGHAQAFDNAAQQKAYNDATINLYQDRPIPAPYARLNLSLYTPSDWGPSIFENKVLGGFRANIVLDWQAGNWTTFNPNNIPSIAYNVETVDFFNTILRVEKTVSFGKFSAQLFVDINNVFNTLRLSNTSDLDYMYSLHLPTNAAYDNIPGNDKVGEYRKPGVDWQPEVYQYEIRKNDGSYTIAPDDERAIFYEGKSGMYWRVNKDQNTGNTSWVRVDQATIDKINKDKAYINMPSISTFWFLNPRQIFFGLKLSFDLGQ